MGFWNYFNEGVKSLTDYNKSETEKLKAQNKKVNIRRQAKENKEFKKAISKSTKVGIIGIITTIVGTIGGVIMGYMLSGYFPIQNS